MENWQICEKECLEFLKKNYADEKFKFEAEGGSDSTKSDILLLKNGIAVFYIESKMKQAQCGQSVVFPNDETRTFIYSPRNKYPLNHQTQVILDKMAEDYDRYKNPTSAGIPLDMDKSYFYDWIVAFYKSKEVKYFIVEKNTGANNLSYDNFLIFPLTHIHKYCDSGAIYRRKTSGSANPTEQNYKEIEEAMEFEGFKKKDIWKDGKYVYVKMDAAPMTYKLLGEEHTYQFKYEANDIFKVTRLSNTSNPDIVFHISLFKDQLQNPLDLDKFNAEFK